ncbi:MAG: hypothetical protein JWR74_723 [Polaromonas sp.]|jgi:hypothetical protein|nr:hypothetical protein [Polaromonas sp.]
MRFTPCSDFSQATLGTEPLQLLYALLIGFVVPVLAAGTVMVSKPVASAANGI